MYNKKLSLTAFLISFSLIIASLACVFIGNEKASPQVIVLKDNALSVALITLDSGASPRVELQVEVFPEHANVKIDWSLEWAGNGWSEGKQLSEYLTVSPLGDGSRFAFVTCNAAFGDPVIVRAKCRTQPAVQAECKVDYSMRLLDLSLKLTDGVSFASLELLHSPFVNYINVLDENGYDDIFYNTTTGLGTVGKLFQYDCRLTFTEGFYNYMYEKGIDVLLKPSSVGYELVPSVLSGGFYGFFYSLFNTISSLHPGVTLEALFRHLSDYGAKELFKITVVVTHLTELVETYSFILVNDEGGAL